MSSSSLDETLAATGTGSESRPALDKPVYHQGDSLGRYVVLSKLGEGGMGVVYAAYDPELDRKIAVKVVRPDVREDETQGGARLLREAQALARLSHPNIVNIYDVGVLDDQVWIAMEFVDGVTLKQWLAERERTWQESLDVLRAAAVGLSAAHQAGLVHRDFKPANVMISTGGRVRVMDFGLARQNEKGDFEASQPIEVPEDLRTGSLSLETELTRPGTLSGTPRYMSPEQFGGRPAGEASDQFSFCIALWEAVYGERPFRGDTALALSFAVTQGNRRPPPRGSKVPGWLRTVLERGLESQPRRRWPSMQALLEALEVSRTRRRRLWGVAAVAAAGLAIAGVVAAEGVEERRAIAACELEGDAMAELWNDETRAEVERAMGTSTKGFALSTIARVTPALDTYAEEWSELAKSSCILANVHDSLDTEAYARRGSCLNTSLEGMRMLVETLRKPETARNALDTAIVATNGLTPVASCSDDARLERIPAPPKDQQEQVQTVRFEHERTQAKVNLGDMAGALETAQNAVAEANTLGWVPLVAESHAMLGRLQGKMGMREESEQSLRTAYFSAAAASADGTAMQTALDLAGAISEDPKRFDEAEDWYEHSQVYADRVHDPNGLLESESFSTLGGIRKGQGELEEAHKLYSKARDIKVEALGERNTQTAVVTNNLALVLDQMGERDEAKKLFAQAMEVLETHFGADHPQVAVALNNLATIQAQSGEKELALRSFRRALEIQEAAFGRESINAAQILINLGQLSGEMGDVKGEDEAYTRAIPIFKDYLGGEHPVYAMTLTNLAGLRVEQERLDEANELYSEALGIMEKALPPEDATITYALDGLGRVARQQGDREAAKGYFERTLSVYEAAYGNEHPDVAYALNHLASIAIEDEDFETATAHASRALEIDKAQASDPIALARHRFTLARAMAGGKRPLEAQRALALSAREAFEAEPDQYEAELAEIRAFVE